MAHPHNRGKGLSWMSDAFIDVDIPLPEGKAKFLDRTDIERGTRLGYLVSTHIAHLDTTHIPAKYKVEKKEGDITIEPTTEVVYSGHLEFTIKDADGFVLMTTKSPPLELQVRLESSGRPSGSFICALPFPFSSALPTVVSSA
jgi:hypothetical protein